MKLGKWRTNSPELRDTIPSELLETEPLYVSSSSISSFPKTLGVHWDTDQDMFYVFVPDPTTAEPTKRDIASHAAKLFYIFGWFAPVTIRVKHLLQRLW